MLNYIEFLDLSPNLAIILVALFLLLQIIGELLEFKGKVVPEFIKIRKYFARKKKEREIFNQVPEALNEVQKSLDDFRSHYNADNIAMRDKWIKNVNEKLEEHDDWRKEFDKKLDKNNEDTLELKIESMRREILNFASYVIDERKPVTREQYKRFYNVHNKYEKIIKENKLENGEVDIAHRIVDESYEKHLKNNTFIEDIRGYNRGYNNPL